MSSCRFIHSFFIHLFRSPSSTNPQPLPKHVLHRLRPTAYSSNFQHHLFSLKSSGSCLRILPRLPVTSILPAIFHSVRCFRKQFLCKMLPIKLTFFDCIVCRTFLSSLAGCNISRTIGPTDLHPSPAPHFKTVQVLVIYSPWCPGFSTIQSYAPNIALH